MQDLLLQDHLTQNEQKASVTKNTEITITGTFLGRAECAKKISLLWDMHSCIDRLNEPNSAPSPRAIVLFNSILLTIGLAFIVAIVVSGLSTKNLPISIAIVVMAVLFSVVKTLATPATHTQHLIELLNEYKPLSRDEYDAIITNIQEKKVLDLTSLKSWVEAELDQVNSIAEKEYPEEARRTKYTL